MKQSGDLVRVRAVGPYSTESELIEEEPVFELRLPDEVIAARRRLDDCAAAKIFDEVTALWRTVDAFLASDLMLASDVGSFADPHSAWLHHPFNHEDLGRALQQLAHSLQSYVASAGGLIDHARRFRQKYAPAGTPIGDEYDQRVAAVFSGPESIMIKGLRNYAMHYSLPMVVGQQQEVSAEGWPTAVFLDAAGLLAGDYDWTAEQRATLKAWPEGVPLGALAEMYSARVLAFYHWLARRIPQWYADAERERQGLEREFHRALRAAGLGEVPKLIDQLERSKHGELGATGARPPRSR